MTDDDDQEEGLKVIDATSSRLSQWMREEVGAGGS